MNSKRWGLNNRLIKINFFIVACFLHSAKNRQLRPLNYL